MAEQKATESPQVQSVYSVGEEEGEENIRSSVITDHFAPPIENQFSEGDEVALAMNIGGRRKKVTAVVYSKNLDSRSRRWEYQLKVRGDLLSGGRWFRESELDYA